jgi:3-hydroxyisobutyrate dehydrogenase-like beta-hydroxyacid dehydrogenase
MTVIGIVAQGAMGSAVGRQLAAAGYSVTTVLDGRSKASAERAAEAGMRAVGWADMADADYFLSILPPDQALSLAERLAPILSGAAKKPVYADCNAVSPETSVRIGKVISTAGAPYVDAGIIGPPPADGTKTTIYACGPAARQLASLGGPHLRITAMDGEIGAASALKMAYAGINKGIQALASAMILAATRAGAADALRDELAYSQPELLRSLCRSLPGMYGKAYRWVGEMEEIAAYAGEDRSSARIYEGAAGLFDRLAKDLAGPRHEIGAIDAFIRER